MKIAFNRQLLPIYLITSGLLLVFVIYLFYNFNLNIIVAITIGWIVLIAFLLWIGNRTITKFLNKELPWAEYLTLRFFIQLLASLIYALICINLSYLAFKLVFTQDPPSPEQVFLVNIYSIFLILPIFSIYYVVYFIKQWKKSKLESEKLQNESIKSQLDSLKNHLDPHFLFNNLNILSGLIEKGEERSKDYLNKFAEVYRYMLQNNSMELIPVTQELEFIDSYMHLIKMRYQNALIFNIDIPEEKLDYTLPPLTIQMLLENCIKHNALSPEQPLKIEIAYKNDDYLSVKNNITARKIKYHSNGSGLENIKSRYTFYTDKKVNVENNGASFRVDIPILEIEEI